MTTASSRPFALQALNCDGAYGASLAGALLLLLLPLAGGGELTLSWRFERAALAGGEFWRLLTAHLVHLDTRHALFNAAGLALLWALFARSYRPTQWLAASALILVAIDAGLWWLPPRLEWYLGASAWLHGVFACGAIALIRSREPMAWIAAAVFAGKLGWEQWQGPLPLTHGPVATASHLYGALGGVVAGLLLRPAREPLY